MEKLTPTTPPKVMAEREQREALQVETMEKESEKVTQCFNKTTQIWKLLEEDDRVQQEEVVITKIQELKKRKNLMSIT
jgi:hypothetical protein